MRNYLKLLTQSPRKTTQRLSTKTHRRPCRFVLFREEEKDDITEKTQEVRVILFDSRYEMSQGIFKYYDTCLFRLLFFRHPSWCILKVMWKPWKNNMLWKSSCCRRNTSKEMQMFFSNICWTLIFERGDFGSRNLGIIILISWVKTLSKIFTNVLALHPTISFLKMLLSKVKGHYTEIIIK